MAKSFPNTGATVGLAADRTALTSPFAGMQFFETDTKALYLYNGSAWVSMLNTNTPPGLVFINKTTFSTVATVTIDSIFTSTYENYRLVITANNTSGSPQAFTMQARAAGSDIAAANWYTAGKGRTSGSVDWNDAQGGVAAVILGYVSWAGYEQSGIVVDLCGPQISGRYTSHTAQSAWISGGGAITMASYGAVYNTGTAFDGAKFATQGGGNTSGTISVYGYR